MKPSLFVNKPTENLPFKVRKGNSFHLSFLRASSLVRLQLSRPDISSLDHPSLSFEQLLALRGIEKSIGRGVQVSCDVYRVVLAPKRKHSPGECLQLCKEPTRCHATTKVIKSTSGDRKECSCLRSRSIRRVSGWGGGANSVHCSCCCCCRRRRRRRPCSAAVALVALFEYLSESGVAIAPVPQWTLGRNPPKLEVPQH